MNHKENIIMTKNGNKLISHRGNISGKTSYENDPQYVISALDEGYDVEVDVTFKDNNFWLGHDNSKYKVNIDFLNDSRLWCHLKDKKSLKQIVDILKTENINYFWHHSKSYMKDFTCKSVVVLPELSSWSKEKLNHCYGICSDYIKEYA